MWTNLGELSPQECRHQLLHPAQVSTHSQLEAKVCVWVSFLRGNDMDGLACMTTANAGFYKEDQYAGIHWAVLIYINC